MQPDDLGFFLARPRENNAIHMVLMNQAHITVNIPRLQRFQQKLESLFGDSLFNPQCKGPSYLVE
jgi:hypothetical protein